MNLGRAPGNGSLHKVSVLLIDRNSERRALRMKILTLRGIDVVGAIDVIEATSMWQPDRYDLILLDIRMDHRSCIAWRDEIKKQKPKQIVAFLVGRPNYIDLEPLIGSYVAEEQGTEWGDALRLAISNGCESLPQRYGLLEARWRIAAGKKFTGASSRTLPVGNSEQSMVDDSSLYTTPAETITEADAVRIALEQFKEVGAADEN
jgi:CheY-like chemotaxis protein